MVAEQAADLAFGRRIDPVEELLGPAVSTLLP
jgi:hypothetical protein